MGRDGWRVLNIAPKLFVACYPGSSHTIFVYLLPEQILNLFFS